MNPYVITGVAGVVCLVLGIIIGYSIMKSNAIKAGKCITGAEEKAKKIIGDAQRDAETKRKEALIEAKEEILKQRNETEKELKERRNEIARLEKYAQQKEESLDKKIESYEQKEELLAQKNQKLAEREAELTKIIEEEPKSLNRYPVLPLNRQRNIFFRELNPSSDTKWQ